MCTFGLSGCRVKPRRPCFLCEEGQNTETLKLAKVGLAKIGHPNFGQNRSSKVGLGLAKVGLAKVGQIRMAKVGLAKVGLSHPMMPLLFSLGLHAALLAAQRQLGRDCVFG